MKSDPQPNYDWLLYCVLLVAIACGAVVIGGEIRETCDWVGKALDGAMR